MSFFDPQNPGIGQTNELTSTELLTVQQISALGSPGADRIFGYDNADTSYKFFVIGSGLTYTHSTHTLSAAGASGLTIGTTTITSGTTTRVLFNNAGVVGEYVISGSGNVAMTTNAVFTTPNLGTPSAITLTNAASTSLAIGAINASGTPSSSNFLRGDGTWSAPAGAGTVTASGGNLTANAIVLGAGTTDTKVVAGIITDGTSMITLGVNTTTLGKLKMFGNTSGDATIQPSAVAGTATVLTLPAVTGTLSTIAGTEVHTNKDLTSGTNTFPTFNQNTTGSAAKWTTARNLAGNSVDGSGNVAFANKFIVQGTTDAGLSAAQFLGALGTGIVKNTTTTGILTIAIAADFPTLNQSTTGSAATLTTARTIGTLTGDITSAGSAFDGSAVNTNATVLATVNANTGSFGTATAAPSFTVNGKGLITAAGTNTITPAVGSITGLGTGVATWLATPSFTNLNTALTGDSVVGLVASQTLTNKRITWRVVSMADATSFTLTGDTADVNTQANTQAVGTLTVNAPSGTPTDGQILMLRLKSTNVQTYAWNAIFRGSNDLPLPAISSGSSKTDYLSFIYNNADTKWDLYAKTAGF